MLKVTQFMRYNSYTLVRANGDIERCRVPIFFDPYSVARRLVHSLVFLDVPKGQYVLVHGDLGNVCGPAVVLVHDDVYYRMPNAPKDDLEANRLWREYGPKTSTAA